MKTKGLKIMAMLIMVISAIGIIYIQLEQPKNHKILNSQSSNSIEQYIDIINNPEYFQSGNPSGTELWFYEWSNFNGIENFTSDFLLEGKVYNQGLGSNGITIDGLDKRGYSSLDFTIVKDKVDNISGIFGFDDNTQIRPNSKLVILSDGEVIYESKYINDGTNSIKVNTNIKKETKVITIRFETEIESEVIPSILFVDIKARKSF